jgi:hypothetical protein
MRSKARRSRLAACAEEEEAERIGADIEVGITIRARVWTLPRLVPVAVIRRATGRLEADCPRATAAVMIIKANDRVQRRRAGRAARNTIVRGNGILLILGERSFSPKRVRP